MTRRLNRKQLAFARHYLGNDPDLAGNATACYRAAYDTKAKPKTVNSMASTLMCNPLIRKLMETATRKAVEAVNWSAETVLAESVRLYDRCMGDADYPVEHSYLDKKTGEIVTTINQERSYNPSGARAALELIGRNTGIQAFQENIEVSHSHHLVQALSRRAKVIEHRATQAIAAPGSEALPATLPKEIPSPGSRPAPGPGPNDVHSPGNDVQPGAQVTATAPAPGSPAPGREAEA